MTIARTHTRDLTGCKDSAVRLPQPPTLRPTPIRGLPKLHHDTLLEFSPDGTTVAIGSGQRVETFLLVRRGTTVTAKRVQRYKLPGKAVGLMMAPDGALFTHFPCGRETTVAHLAGGAIQVLSQVPERPLDAVATHQHVVLALAGDFRGPPQLVVLYRRHGDGHPGADADRAILQGLFPGVGRTGGIPPHCHLRGHILCPRGLAAGR